MKYYWVTIKSVIPENAWQCTDVDQLGECTKDLIFRSAEKLETTVPIRKVCQTLPGFKRVVQVSTADHFVNEDRWNRLGSNKKFTIS